MATSYKLVNLVPGSFHYYYFASFSFKAVSQCTSEHDQVLAFVLLKLSLASIIIEFRGMF